MAESPGGVNPFAKSGCADPKKRALRVNRQKRRPVRGVTGRRTLFPIGMVGRAGRGHRDSTSGVEIAGTQIIAVEDLGIKKRLRDFHAQMQASHSWHAGVMAA
jgi:hypothetical protein